MLTNNRVHAPLWLVLLCLTLIAALPSAVSAGQSFAKVFRSSDTRSLTEWGRRYQHGEGVKQDLTRAMRLYCKAARKGDVAAQYYLGWMYAHGTGIKRDEQGAAAWFYKAAAQNDRPAANMLKRMGFRGKPKRRATCHLGDDRLKIANRAHPAKGAVAKLVRGLATEYRLDPNLVLAVIEQESNFNPAALSPKNAQGLMQLMPATAQRFGVEDVWDPEQNVRGGMAYLSWLMDHFDGDVQMSLAAYNAGEGAVKRHGGIPPYRETQDYVVKIMKRLDL